MRGGVLCAAPGFNTLNEARDPQDGFAASFGVGLAYRRSARKGTFMASNPRNIQLLVLDVDGVLTDGSIWVGQDGYEMKRFHVRDGLGIKIWMKLGYQVAVISGRNSMTTQRRMDELGVTLVYQGVKDKQACLSDLLDRTGLSLAQVAYVGDDWPDAGVMKRVGYPITVADADAGIKRMSAFVTTRDGGQGAVREAIDHLLTGMGKTDDDRASIATDGSELPRISAVKAGRRGGDEIFPG
jgi:3-deoxy-D-manno-octulosonate 8-phosphate phosphatase (KDO 8-P phosphatase)